MIRAFSDRGFHPVWIAIPVAIVIGIIWLLDVAAITVSEEARPAQAAQAAPTAPP
jgi:hypothetical protein